MKSEHFFQIFSSTFGLCICYIDIIWIMNVIRWRNLHLLVFCSVWSVADSCRSFYDTNRMHCTSNDQCRHGATVASISLHNWHIRGPRRMQNPLRCRMAMYFGNCADRMQHAMSSSSHSVHKIVAVIVCGLQQRRPHWNCQFASHFGQQQPLPLCVRTMYHVQCIDCAAMDDWTVHKLVNSMWLLAIDGDDDGDTMKMLCWPHRHPYPNSYLPNGTYSFFRLLVYFVATKHVFHADYHKSSGQTLWNRKKNWMKK